MKSGNWLFLFKILPFLRSLIWEKTIIDLGHAEKMTFDSSLPCSGREETGSYRLNSNPAPEKWDRMALRNPSDNGGLLTVVKCKTDLALLLCEIFTITKYLSGDRLFNPASQSCCCLGEVWISDPAWRPQAVFHWNTGTALADRAKGKR